MAGRGRIGNGQTRLEAAQVRFNRLAFGADGGAKRLRLDRQCLQPRQDTEHDDIERAPAVGSDRRQVGQHQALGEALQGAAQLVFACTAIGHGNFLVRRIDAAVGGDNERTGGRDESRLHHAGSLEQLGCQQNVDLAGRRIEPQDRHRRPGGPHHLDVVGGGARALRHTGDRGAAYDQPAGGSGLADPARQHTAAFAPERGDQQADGLRLGHRHHSAGTSAGAAGVIAAVRPPSRRIRARDMLHAQAIPGARVLDDVDLRERGAELRRVRDLAAQAASHAVVVDVGDRDRCAADPRWA